MARHRRHPSSSQDLTIPPDSPTSQYTDMSLHPPVASSSRDRSIESTSTAHLVPTPSHLDSDPDDQVFDPFAFDMGLQLRSTRTAHSVIAESIRSERDVEQWRRKRSVFSRLRRMTMVKESFRSKRSESNPDTLSTSTSEHGASPRKPSRSRATIIAPPSSESLSNFFKGKGKAKAPLPRRTIFVNLPVPSHLLSTKGDLIVRYVRNKVRTSKYTILSFIPKNLYEQFRRVANVFFLALVILPIFPIFGAVNAQIGMLPLLFILAITAIKDGIEDWRRAKLDNQVNNSATTKLGGWRNVNQPKDPRSFFERLLGLGLAPDQPSKGVRKLRQKEANAGHKIVMNRRKAIDDQEELNGVVIMDKETYPLESIPRLSNADPSYREQMIRKMPSVPSLMSRKSAGVLSWDHPASGNAQWERTLWKKLEVGDLVLLRDNDQVPADIIVLATSNPDALAFVETKNLDGETNLKVRKALKATSSIMSEEDLEHAHFAIDSEPPHANLYTYNGVLKYRPALEGKGGNEEKQEAVTINELLLRGCSIRNTKWVIGLVVFTGADTKIMLNGGNTPSKRSKIEKETNFNVIMNFLILIILCVTTAILHGWYRSLSGTSEDYYEVDSEASSNLYVDSIVIFASCLIVFQNIVPISLYITIEIVKTIQAYFIFQDVEMYYEPYDTSCVPKTWNISDDLGQIEYVFSDKTGTLTQNVMEFKKCSVHGVPFGEGLTEAMMGAAKRDGRDLGPAMANQDAELAVLKDKMVKEMTRTINNRYLREDKLTLIAPELPARLSDQTDPLRPYLLDFFRALSICHTVLADEADPDKPFVLNYKAESPDEAALVAAARDVGFPFVTRNNMRIDIEVLGQTERWEPLRVLEFNSTRKRMSVIARDPSGRIVLFCKGADSVIYERLAHDQDPVIKTNTLRDLETFANGGLRTLCIAHRYLREDEFDSWAKKFDAASAAVNDREHEIEKACELIEHSLNIIGATALEDKLQEGVPDAIAMLHRAGIKLWILTGDKLQTAIEIGYSCNLLTNDMEVMIISADSEDGARAQIEAGLNKISSVVGATSLNRNSTKEASPSTGPATFAVVIDGDSLRYALQPTLKNLFLTLGTQCSAVICCRVSPSQKALTVKLVKEGRNAMTLSIGDGANDVAMIQEANVGVGLYGLEGSQAAMSADYAFGQFRFLTRLLLVHGRWSYIRIANMHANFFYKNIIWTVSMFWFLIFNSFDATILFEYSFVLLYNLVFTSLPVGMMGAFDQDTNARASLAFPQLYKRGVQGLDYTRTRFWLYMADGLYQSAIIFFIPFLAYGSAAPWSHDGRDTDSLWEFGTTVAAAGGLAANLYVGINTRYWTIITWVVVPASTALLYIWIPIYSALATNSFNGVVGILYPTFSFWAIVVITVFCAVGPRWLASAIQQSYLPHDRDLIREAWVAGDLKAQLWIPHRREGASPETATSGLIDHLQKTLGDGNTRGDYEPANTSSPQKERIRSPLMSGTVTPQSPDLESGRLPLSPTPGSHPRVPPPLLHRYSSGSVRSVSSPGRLAPSVSHSPIGTPVSRLSYTSPTAIEAYSLSSREIKRMSRASNELRRASLTLSPDDSNRLSKASTTGGKRSSFTLDPIGYGERRFSTSPLKRTSMGGMGLLRVPTAGHGLSPVRANVDRHEGHVDFGPGWHDDHGRGSEEVDAVDFSERRAWEEERRRASMMSFGEHKGEEGKDGYAV